MSSSDDQDSLGRITELEKKVHELEQGLDSHKMVIDSLMRICETLDKRLTEVRDEFIVREKKLPEEN